MRHNLKQLLAQKSQTERDSRPVIFDLAHASDQDTVAALFAAGNVQHVRDDYATQLEEYFATMHPALVYAPGFTDAFRAYEHALRQEIPLWQQGRWVYFPWINTLAHILEDAAFQRVRTARNQNLITAAEQKKFYQATIGIAGLSVGNSVALAIVLQGGARRIRLADHDSLALSNLNRIRAGVENLGLSKVAMTAREIYALNPYTEVEMFSDGLDKENIARFFDGPPQLDIMIDEIDNLAMKYLIREQARARRIAVVMAADNGDSGVVDIERYDEDPNTPFFHGRLGPTSYDDLAALDKFGTGRMIARLVGAKNITDRMERSLAEMGKTIVSWPQLGGAALLNGSAVAYCVRKILNREPLEKNRAIISLDEKLIPDGHPSAPERDKSAPEREKRAHHRRSVGPPK